MKPAKAPETLREAGGLGSSCLESPVSQEGPEKVLKGFLGGRGPGKGFAPRSPLLSPDAEQRPKTKKMGQAPPPRPWGPRVREWGWGLGG